MTKQLRIIPAFALAVALGFSAFFTNNRPAIAAEPLTEDSVRMIVREYLLEHPEILVEVQQALHAKQEAEMAERQRQTIEENSELLYNADYQITFGNDDAKTTVVEFFDYNCGYCQRAMADMQRFLENDKNVRFVLKEFPVLGPPSMEASRVSMAFSKVMPEKYGEFHLALLNMSGIKNGERAMELAESLGADRADMTREMENPAIEETIQSIYRLADGLGISGTPSYVAGDEVVFGAVGYDQLKSTILKQRN